MLKPNILVLLVLPILVGSCTSSHLVNSWRDPSFAGPIQFKKTLVLIIHPDGAIRRAAEDELVRQIGPERAVAGHQAVTEDERKDLDKLKAKLQAIGADGVVTMQMVGARTETTWTPARGSPGQFTDDFSRATARNADPGYVRSDRIVSIETKIYSVTDGKLIWSGVSDTFEPSKVETAVAEIAKAVGSELRKQKLLDTPKQS